MRVVVLGAGYAGLTVVRRLERSLPESVELVLVDESDSHLLQHELHRVIRRPDLTDTITLSLADLTSRATVRQARVTDIDVDERRVTLVAEGEVESLSYDVAAICLGAETAFYDLPGVEAHGLPLKRLAHAHEIRTQVLDAPGGDVVVGGAGLSGIQVAGELAALSTAADRDHSVTLVEAAEQVAPQFGETFAGAIRRELTGNEIAVETGVAVTRADAEGVHLEDGRTLTADVFVWTGGIRGPAPLDGERAPVEADLRVAEGTFVVGDAGAVVDVDGTAVPASAQTAVRQARIAARNIEASVSDAGNDQWERPPRRYRYDDLGWVVSVGDDAVARLGPVVVNGDPARAAKAAIGASHLGSVGAMGRASRLVGAELGWPTDCDQSSDALDAALASLPTDPASAGSVGYPLASLVSGLAGTVVGEEPLDLTY